eukprot:TRINITY_DN7875_c0_g2_i1.p1 TRINITY_DN7875_c0_g2~~TRINITY_DN7875_c0_g2_i1.p1  ORF type:complete len:155 (+),score=24.89 TRINITY_DN7875_c0_g2_i1:39-503(+)
MRSDCRLVVLRSLSAAMDQVNDECQVSNRYCRVQKHRFVGCAIVSVASMAVRSAIIRECSIEGQAQAMIRLGDIQATVVAHVDRVTREEVPQALFVGWGSSVEKRTPLSADVIAEVFFGVINQLMQELPPSSFAPQAEEIPASKFTYMATTKYQ